MKKIICLLVLGFALFVNADLVYANEDIRVFVDFRQVDFDQPPVIYEGRTLIPVRAVSEALGGVVEYVFDEEESIVTVEKGDIHIIFFMEKNIAILNSEEVVLDTAPQIIGDRAMVPLRFIGESFGLEVVWDEVHNDVYIQHESLALSPDELLKFAENQQEDLVNAWADLTKRSVINPSIASITRNLTYAWEDNYVKDNVYTTRAGGTSKVEYAEDIPIDSLVQISGFIEDVIISNDENEPSYIFIQSAGIVWSARFMGNMFNEESIGEGYYLYGIFEGVNSYFGFEAPMIYILRDIDLDNIARTHKLSGFEMAHIFEGEPLLTPKDIEDFLNANYADKSSGVPYFVFQIVENAEFDFTVIVTFNENHQMGNALRFADISQNQREAVAVSLKKYMLMLANGLTQKCPDINFNGYYYDSYTVSAETGEETYEMRFASWTNNVSEIYRPEDGAGLIKWLPALDFEWTLR